MKRELYINGRILDLSDNEPIALSYQSNDIAELSDRQANYSNTFTVPDTNNNRVVLGFSNSAQSNTNIPYRKSPCVYIESGVYKFQNGIAITEEYNESFQITMYSGTFDFFSQLGERSLKDLDWSEYDHLYDAPTIKDINYNYTIGASDVCWPMVQWGAHKKNEDFDLRYQNPAISFPAIINKIVASTTYNKAGQIFGDGIYTDMALLLNPEKYGVDADSLEARTYIGGIASDGVISDNGVAYRPRRLNTSNLIRLFNNFDNGQDSENVFVDDVNPPIVAWPIPNIPGPTFNTTSYRADGYYTLQIDFKVKFRSIYLFGGELYCIYKNGKEESAVSLFPDLEIDRTWNNVDFASTFNLDVEPGDIIIINMFALYFTIYGSDGPDTNYLSIAAIDSAPVFGNVSYNSIVPDYRLKDIIRSFCQQFALMISTDANTVTFTKFTEIKGNIEAAEDWSDKLDLSSEPIINYRIGNYAQVNHMRYAQDENTNGFADALFTIDDRTLSPETELVSLIYPSALIEQDIYFTNKKNEGVKIPKYTLIEAEAWVSSKSYAEGDTVNYGGQIWTAASDSLNVVPGTNLLDWTLNDYQYEATETGPARLVLIRRIHPTYNPVPADRNWNVTYVDGVNAVEANVYYVPMAYFADATQAYNLTFNYLLVTYYPELMLMLSQLKAVNCLMRLTDADISKLNFLKLKYIKYFGNHFYLNKVEDYISGQSARVQLIRM